MSNEYRYRRRHILGPVLVVLLSLLWIGTLYSINPNGTIAFLAYLTVYLSVLLIPGIPVCYLCYRNGATRFAVTRDELVHTTREGVRRYPLDAVYVLDASPRVGGAFRGLKLKAGDDVVELGWGLEDITGFIRELKEKLDARNLSHHYDRRKLLAYFSRIVKAKDLWSGAVAAMVTFGLLFANICAGSCVGFACGESEWGEMVLGRGFRYFFLWIVFSFVFWYVMLLIAGAARDLLVAKREIDEGSFWIGPLDTASERKIIGRCFILASLSYMIISACVCSWIGALR